MISYTLPYLFQSFNTANPPWNGPNYKLSVCDYELTNTLKYTDSFGRLGTHPNYPPFPLCHSKVNFFAPREMKEGDSPFPSVFNPASFPEGIPYMYDKEPTIDPIMLPDFFQNPSSYWVTEDWTASFSLPDTLVKTVSSGTMYDPPDSRDFSLYPHLFLYLLSQWLHLLSAVTGTVQVL